MDTVTAFAPRRQEAITSVLTLENPETTKALAVKATYLLSEDGRKASLLAGGWLRRRGRRRLRRNWSECFGLLLSCVWACTGLYMLCLLYWVDVFKHN